MEATEVPKDDPPKYCELFGYSSEYPPPPPYTLQPIPSSEPIHTGYQSQPPELEHPSQQAIDCNIIFPEQPQNTDTMVNRHGEIGDSMVSAVAVTLFCFPPTGIAAFVYSWKAQDMARAGSLVCAQQAHVTSVKLSKASLFIGILCHTAFLIQHIYCTSTEC
ncbi:uncharacterized protein LOC118767386 [Octopus sinensis]|uniref:Uncharacterized protein LOC118767386 n=1 Tax=Octopus sinensis TaxID=2607531 RepID=A0A7E6FK60_9MOLL|nr:uncharacterized protein LOC118767386 [Octopus sinensis]